MFTTSLIRARKLAKSNSERKVRCAGNSEAREEFRLITRGKNGGEIGRMVHNGQEASIFSVCDCLRGARFFIIENQRGCFPQLIHGFLDVALSGVGGVL